MRDTSVNEIIGVMNAQRELYAALITLSEEKKDAAVNNKVAKLSEIVRKEETILIELKTAENKRKKLMEVIAGRLQMPAGDVTVSAIAGICPADMLEELERVRGELSAALRTLKALNEVNRGIVENKIEFMNLMRGSNDYVNSYAPRQRGKPAGNTAGILDLGV